MENHNFSWENSLYLAIFNSYFDITRGYHGIPHRVGEKTIPNGLMNIPTNTIVTLSGCYSNPQKDRFQMILDDCSNI
jgi:hypothetical protein